MSTSKKRLRAVEVPWQSSPSESIVSFGGKEGEVNIRILGFFGPKVLENTHHKLIRDYGEDVPDDLWNKAGYENITNTFDSVSVFCMHPPQLPYGLLDENSYDFSEINLHYTESMSFSEWSSKFDSQWAAKDACPDPRFYEVIDSHLLHSLGVNSPFVRHWILLGHDAYFEIVGRSFQWKVD